ncbi:MAG TPA: hypothetical protein VD731_02385 [Nitrosopumilaceae archaeon]|nr:hypothetical protein [Nitrosopumilaceae archaeon]
MTKNILTILFLTTILATSAISASVEILPQADAATQSSGTPVKQYGSATKDKVCGDRLCSETGGKTEMPSVSEEETPSEPKKETPSEPKTPSMEKSDHPMWKSATGTITSVQDPGIGHETHQLAIILPPSDKVYKGMFSYDASEPIQLVALHGPLADGEDAGQPIWTPDGKTKFALTFIDPKTSMGSWAFTGNALAIHTMNKVPFTASYSVSYMENEMSDTVMTGTLESMVDPGMGHETHQLAIILPPSEKTYSGILTYSASEPIQLVALHGPLGPGEDKGQAIWTPDGKTKFALTFVDDKSAMGTWIFAGNALAVHTMNEEPFTVSYSVVAGQ